MAPERSKIMGVFSSQEQAAAAIRGLSDSRFTLERVHGPIPSHTIADALQLPKGKVGLFTLAGGIIGFFCGFLLAIFTSGRWELIVSGKPVVALVPFFIVGFEFTILFSVLGNVLGLVSQMRLPRFETDETYDPRFTGAKFGVLASCETALRSELQHFFEAKGAETKIYA
jgi:molybdopterin-containing oxidoreductase family membrane subunit